MRQKSMGVLLAAALASGSGVAHAQAADKAAAEALFEQGRELLAAGNFTEACKRFEASQALDAGVGTLLHLADCYERANLRASAWATFEEAASLARTRGDKRAEIATVRAAALRPQLAYLRLEVAAPLPDGLTITSNGRPIPKASWGVPVPVDAGKWHIRASAPGYQIYEAEIEVSYSVKEPLLVRVPALDPVPPVGETPPQTVAPAPISETPPLAGPAQAEDAGETQRFVGIGLGAAGVAALVVGGVLAGLAAKRADDSNAHCATGERDACDPRGKSLRDDALSFANAATYFTIGGGVALAGGTVLYFTATTADDQPQTNALSQLTAGLRGTW